MKNSITYSVNKPCSADWSSFSTTSTGGFCPVCKKNVVDFTRMSDDELIDFLKNSGSQTCGMFRKEQLNQPYPRSVASPLKWVRTGLLSLLVLAATVEMQAQDLRMAPVDSQAVSASLMNISEVQRVRGIVRDEFGDPIPGTNILLKGTTIGTVADIEGKFEFPRELENGDVLVFSFIGYKTREYVVGSEQEETIEIEMEMMVDILGEVVLGGVYTSQSGIGRLWTGLKNIFR